MSAKHTPGPWLAERTPESSYFDWYVRGKRFAVGINTDNNEADARLIASAPDLLDALRAMEHEFGRTYLPGSSSAVDAARAAIAKALGEAP